MHIADGKVQGTSRCDGGWPGAHGWSIRGQQKQHALWRPVHGKYMNVSLGSNSKQRLCNSFAWFSGQTREKLWSVYAMVFFISRAALTSKDLVRCVLDLVSLTCKCHVTVCSETNERQQLSKRKERLPRWDVFLLHMCFHFLTTCAQDAFAGWPLNSCSCQHCRSANFSRTGDSTVNFQRVTEEVTSLFFLNLVLIQVISFMLTYIQSFMSQLSPFCSNVLLIVGLYSLVLRDLVQHANHGASQEEGEPQDEDPKISGRVK